MDAEYDKARNAAIKFNGNAFYTIEEAIKYIDIAIVATPDNEHYKILKQLAKYPLKLVICEKPICEDLQQAREIVELYKIKGILLMVNYTRRFLPYYHNIKELSDSGMFGDLVSANIVFNRGWLHTASHAIDFIEWLFNGNRSDRINIVECNTDYRIWQIQLFWEKHYWQEQRISDMPVWSYYDKTHWHVVDNAYKFLEGKEGLMCTGEDALNSLEMTYKLMK